MRHSVLVLAAALGACTAPSGPAPQEAETAAAQPAAPSFDGHYVVTLVDGAAPVIGIAGHQPMVTIKGARVHFQSQCIYADWTLHRDAGKVSARPYYEPGSAMCARALAPGERAIQDAFTNLETLEPAGDARLVVVGGGHRLELREAAEAPRPAAAETGTLALTPVTTLAGEWRVAGIDGKPLDAPQGIALSGSDRELWWEPRCAGFVRSYRIDGLRFTPGPRLDAPAPPPPGTPPPPVCTIGLLPGLQDVFRAVNAATTVGRDPSNGILLSGGGHSVLLYSQ
ncbi:hypothetical protein GRI40_08540 [Altererythrobacter aerius]|uniref:META domain-containing protein n=1 Tax=Tsuneonella aeria TaxID=1837929 RepID=A0A6I4TD76_9SPHN|nr:hypothetical protein [Tsuneonella aeria]MXO75261.1 hypothetical protein [Tsuneonella aeria]